MKESGCSARCAGDHSMHCGGVFKNSVYKSPQPQGPSDTYSAPQAGKKGSIPKVPVTEHHPSKAPLPKTASGGGAKGKVSKALRHMGTGHHNPRHSSIWAILLIIIGLAALVSLALYGLHKKGILKLPFLSAKVDSWDYQDKSTKAYERERLF